MPGQSWKPQRARSGELSPIPTPSQPRPFFLHMRSCVQRKGPALCSIPESPFSREEDPFSPTREKRTNPPRVQGKLGQWGDAGIKEGGRWMAAHHLLLSLAASRVTRGHWLSPHSSSSPGDMHGLVSLLQGNKAKPQGPFKGLSFTELPPTELLLCKTFLPKN